MRTVPRGKAVPCRARYRQVTLLNTEIKRSLFVTDLLDRVLRFSQSKSSCHWSAPLQWRSRSCCATGVARSLEPYSAACFSLVGTVSPDRSAAFAASYSALRRATISAAGGASNIWPTPWPAPQMSRHALALELPPEPKFILLLSATGRSSGSRPEAATLFFR